MKFKIKWQIYKDKPENQIVEYNTNQLSTDILTDIDIIKYALNLQKYAQNKVPMKSLVSVWIQEGNYFHLIWGSTPQPGLPDILFD